jgi:hypothetical protein
LPQKSGAFAPSLLENNLEIRRLSRFDPSSQRLAHRR